MGSCSIGLAFCSALIEVAVEELQEDPLRPPVVFGVGRGDLAVPVIAEAERLGLAPHVDDVLGGRQRRVRARLDRVLLGGQAEGIPAKRVQHIEPFHPLVAGDDIAGGVAFRMPDVQTLAARIGEHVQHVVLRPGRIAVLGPEGLVLLPELLPLLLDRPEVICAFLYVHRSPAPRSKNLPQSGGAYNHAGSHTIYDLPLRR